MIRAKYLVMNVSNLNFVRRKIGHEEIVNSPSDISFACIHAVRPPRVFLFVGVKVSERIDKPRIKQLPKLLSFFVGEAGVKMVSVWVCKVDGHICDIQIPTYYYGFSFFGCNIEPDGDSFMSPQITTGFFASSEHRYCRKSSSQLIR